MRFALPSLVVGDGCYLLTCVGGFRRLPLVVECVFLPFPLCVFDLAVDVVFGEVHWRRIFHFNFFERMRGLSVGEVLHRFLEEFLVW